MEGPSDGLHEKQKHGRRKASLAFIIIKNCWNMWYDRETIWSKCRWWRHEQGKKSQNKMIVDGIEDCKTFSYRSEGNVSDVLAGQPKFRWITIKLTTIYYRHQHIELRKIAYWRCIKAGYQIMNIVEGKQNKNTDYTTLIKVSDFTFFKKTWWISMKRACRRLSWTFMRKREFFQPVNSVNWWQTAFEWDSV